MKIRTIFTCLLVITIAILFVFATPGVNFKVFNKTVKFDGLNLDTITNSKYKGELQFGNGTDIRGGKKYTFQASLKDVAEGQREAYSAKIAEQFAARIELYSHNRLNTNAFRQFDLRWYINGENVNIELITAKKSDQDYQIISLLASKAKLEFLTEDPNYDSSKATDDSSYSFLTGMKQSDLSMKDIEHVESLYSAKANGYGFKITFNESARTRMIMLSQNETSRGTILMIDNEPIAYRVYPVENITSGSKAKPIMYLASFQSDFAVNDTVPAIFNNGEISQELTLINEENVTPMLGDHYEWDLKLVLGVALVLMIALLIAQFRETGLYFLGLIAFLGITDLAGLKLLKLSLTFPLVLGSMAAIAFALVLHTIILREISASLRTTKKTNYFEKIPEFYKKDRANYRNFVLLVMGQMILLNFLPMVEIADFASGFLMVVIFLFLSVYTFPNLFLTQILSIKYRYETHKKS